MEREKRRHGCARNHAKDMPKAQMTERNCINKFCPLSSLQATVEFEVKKDTEVFKQKEHALDGPNIKEVKAEMPQFTY